MVGALQPEIWYFCWLYKGTFPRLSGALVTHCELEWEKMHSEGCISGNQAVHCNFWCQSGKVEFGVLLPPWTGEDS